jgi:hypothetical protein
MPEGETGALLRPATPPLTTIERALDNGYQTTTTIPGIGSTAARRCFGYALASTDQQRDSGYNLPVPEPEREGLESTLLGHSAFAAGTALPAPIRPSAARPSDGEVGWRGESEPGKSVLAL